MTTALPPILEITPLPQPPKATVRVPGSKSITNRALVLAALAGAAEGCRLSGVLRSQDTEVMVDGLRQLGYPVTAEWSADTITVRRPAVPGTVPAREADVFAANSGTTLRFLTAVAGLGSGRYRFDGSPRMRQRPVADLLAALRQLGVEAVSENDTGCPPVIVRSRGLRGGTAHVRGETSSQFVSGLLMVAPWADEPVTIDVIGELVSRPYVDMTVAMVRHFGGRVQSAGPQRFVVTGHGPSHVRDYAIEPDATAASYFFAAAAITGGEVSVVHLPRHSLQGDVRFLSVLEQMGCTVSHDDTAATVRGGRLRGVDVDMNDISDTVMTLAAVACFADGPTTIRNVAHVRYKESDRLAALATELGRLGAHVELLDDGLRINPSPLHGGTVETYDDHRIAMSFALIGLRIPGILIKEPACVGKTYPGFFEDLDRLRQG